MTWHLTAEAVTRYGNGTAHAAEAASAEAHLVRCGACRDAVAAFADGARLDRVLAGVVDVLDQPRPGVVERLLRAAGIPGATARLLAATPALRTSWLLSVLGSLVFAVLAARGNDGDHLLLLLAPVLPVLGVALAYGPLVDDTYEVGVAAPFGGLRLVLLRAGTVLATTVGMTLAGALAMGDTALVAGWLLPALALTVVTLALGTTWDTTRAAAAVCGAWLLGTTAALRRDIDVGGPATQLLCLLLLLGGAALLAARHDRYERGVGA